MIIQHKAGQELELWVKDTGTLNGGALFVNGGLVTSIFTASTAKFPIETSANKLTINFAFAGGDGGATAIVNVANGAKEELGFSTGLNHIYEIQP